MNKDKQAGIVILPEHQKRSDLPAILEAFKKYNRFAMGEMTGDELRASRINPNELRYFGAEVYQYFDPDQPLHFRSRLQTLSRQPKKRLAFATGPIKDTVIFHFLTIDPLYTSSGRTRKELRTLLDIWQGKYPARPKLPKRLIQVLSQWPVVIQQTSGQVLESGWLYNKEAEEYEIKLKMNPIYEVLQIGWTDDDLAPYL